MQLGTALEAALEASAFSCRGLGGRLGQVTHSLEKFWPEGGWLFNYREGGEESIALFLLEDSMPPQLDTTSLFLKDDKRHLINLLDGLLGADLWSLTCW